MTKEQRARNLLLEIEAVRALTSGSVEELLRLTNEVFRDAEALAKQTLEEYPELKAS